MNRRSFLKSGLLNFGLLNFGLLNLGVGAVAAPLFAGRTAAASKPLAPAAAGVAGLLPELGADIEGITAAEHEKRILKAQALMVQAGLDALVLEPGAAMTYFTGLMWRRSERLTAVIIPREGRVGVVTPFFEEPSVRQSLSVPADVLTWHEDADPFERVAEILRDRASGCRAARPGAAGLTIGLEASVRFFAADGIRKLPCVASVVGGASVSAACRMVKSPHEIALMRRANRITLKAYEAVINQVTDGQTPSDIGALMKAEMARLGGSSPWALVLIGKASAYPHGSNDPQIVRAGEIVLMDCGCAYKGYQADISRTFVMGQASDMQRRLWDIVRAGQDIAFKAARNGAPAGAVDDAVRTYYEGLGFGPDYKTPGLSHRTGHGIGMEGHEPVNFVRGETVLLQSGMCFSNEPGLYDFSAFGVRLEDCLYMTDEGPRWFTEPPHSIDSPLGRFGA